MISSTAAFPDEDADPRQEQASEQAQQGQDDERVAAAEVRVEPADEVAHDRGNPEHVDDRVEVLEKSAGARRGRVAQPERRHRPHRHAQPQRPAGEPQQRQRQPPDPDRHAEIDVDPGR
jgi:hypothetical protein